MAFTFGLEYLYPPVHPHYRQRHQKQHLPSLDILSASPGLQSSLFSATLSSPESFSWPPPRAFVQRFLSALERGSVALDEEAYEALERSQDPGYHVFLLVRLEGVSLLSFSFSLSLALALALALGLA